MSTISLRLPESLHASARTLAEQEDISLNQLITLALAEKVSALMTEEHLKARSPRKQEEVPARPQQSARRGTGGGGPT